MTTPPNAAPRESAGPDPFLLALVEAHLPTLRDTSASRAERERRYVALRILLAGGALS